MDHKIKYVLADGFFEWKRLDLKTKIPHFISLKYEEPFFIAGIYEAATDLHPETYALLTCGPNALMEGIHDRMPVILTEKGLERWLEPGAMEPEAVAEICVPYAPDKMVAWPVSTIVNSTKNDVPECVAALENL